MKPYIKTWFCLLAVFIFASNLNAQDCDFDFEINLATSAGANYPELDISHTFNNVEISVLMSNSSEYTFEWYNELGDLISTENEINVSSTDPIDEIFDVHVTNSESCTVVKSVTRNIGISKIISNVNQEICGFNGGGSASVTVDGLTEDYAIQSVFGLYFPTVNFNGGESGTVDGNFPSEPFGSMNAYWNGNSLLFGFVVLGSSVHEGVTYQIQDANLYTIPPQIDLDNSISLLSSQHNCAPSYLGQLEVLASNDLGNNIEYSWTNSLEEIIGTSTMIDNLESGTYTITTTDTNNGCLAQEQFEIDDIDFGVSFSVNPADCGPPDLGSILASGPDGSDYNYEWNSITPDLDFTTIADVFLQTPHCNEEFVMTVSDQTGCVRISDPILLPCVVNEIELNGQISMACDGTSSDILLSPEGGNGGPYTYAWYDGGTAISNDQDLLNLNEDGEYVVLVNDVNGCVQQGNFNVQLQPVEIVIEDEIISPVLCHGGSTGNIEISLEGGTEPYNFQWSNGHDEEDLLAVEAGNYLLDVVDASGCEETFNFDLIEPEAIQATFIANDYLCPENVMGSIDAEFDGGVGNLNILWINGETTEDIIDLTEGTYFVNVTDDNGCVEEFSQEINLVEDYNYSDETILSSADDLNDQTINIQNLLIVPSGLSVEVNNSTLNFTENGGILVEPGASLEINNSVLSNAGCSEFWRGIDVSGTNNLKQTEANQGLCIIHDSEIRNAQIGISNYNREDKENTQGGIIQTVYTDFINCELGADIYKYKNVDWFANAQSEQRIKVEFYNSSFLVDDNYELPGFPKYRIKLYRTRGAKIEGCTIRNTNSSLFQQDEMIGVYASRSTYALTNNWVGYPPYNDVSAELQGAEITGFHYGLKSGMNASLFSTIIDDVDFSNFRGIYLGYAYGARCTSNRFTNLGADMINFNPSAIGYESNSHYGLYLNYSTAYWVEDNSFDFPDSHADRGIVVKSSGENNNLIYNNDFSDCLYGVRSLDDNRGEDFQRGLNINCNELTDSRIDIAVGKSYDGLALPGQGIAEFQGSLPAVDFGNSAGNKLSNIDLINFYDIHNMMDPIIYLHTPVENIQIVNSSVDLNILNIIENQCETNLLESKEIKLQKVVVFDSNLGELFSEYESTIDGGDSEGLLDIITIAKPSIIDALRTRLLDISPNLSDDVILALIENEENIPLDLLLRVLNACPWAVKSNEIVDALKLRDNPLTESQWNYISQGISLPTAKETLESNISYNSSSKDAMFSQSMILLGSEEESNGLIEEQILFLDENPSLNSSMHKASLLVDLGESEEAENILLNLTSEYELSEKNEDDILRIQSIINMEQNLDQAGLLSAEDLTYLIEISEMNFGRSPGYASLFLEELGYVIPDERLIDQELGSRSMVQFSVDLSKNQMRIFPNPSDGHFFMEMDQESKELNLMVYEGTGKLIHQEKIARSNSMIPLDLSNLPQGLYVIQVTNHEHNLVHTEKIQIQ